jgi:hypothetical protein
MLKTLSNCDWAVPVNRQRQKNGTTMTNFLDLTKKIHIHSCLFSEDRETKPNLTKTKKRKGKKKASNRQSVSTTNLSRGWT